jgi:NAD(P)-dependent dehydrogenase (short-subunit alcohol dehydrogenase family)
MVVLAARRADELAVVAAEIAAQPGAGRAVPVETDVTIAADLEALVARARAVAGESEGGGETGALDEAGGSGGNKSGAGEAGRETGRSDGARGNAGRGEIAALINVAGIGSASSIMTDDDRAVAMISTNLTAPIRLMRAVIPSMKEAGRGSIINIGSVAGEIGANGIYSATKFGLRGVTDSVRRELAGTGVQVSLIEPGFIATPLTAHRKGRMPGPDIVVDAVESALRRPRRRIIVPKSYAFAVFFSNTFPAVADRMLAGKAAG